MYTYTENGSLCVKMRFAFDKLRAQIIWTEHWK